jgi:hypothetical protein
VRWYGRKYLMDGPVIALTWEEKIFISKRVEGMTAKIFQSINREKCTFCVIKSLEHLQNF